MIKNGRMNITFAVLLAGIVLMSLNVNVFAALERPSDCEEYQREGYDWETRIYPDNALCKITGDIEVVSVGYDVVTPSDIYIYGDDKNVYNEKYRTSTECIIERISVQIDSASMQLSLDEGATEYSDNRGPRPFSRVPRIVAAEYLGSKGSYSGGRVHGDTIYLTADRRNVNVNVEHQEGVEPLTESESAFKSAINVYVSHHFGIVDWRISNDKNAYTNAYRLRSSTFKTPDTSVYPAEQALCVARQVNEEAKRQQAAAEQRLARLQAIEKEIGAIRAGTQAIIGSTNATAEQIKDFIDLANTWVVRIRAWLQDLTAKFINGP